ncbi:MULTISPECIES: hypothetical protein [unclassified Microbacterium]|uniref:hypothetical protein n=1 Tax=unclassified Microbacterium TaxID=2609290 RepID=UPI00300FF144
MKRLFSRSKKAQPAPTASRAPRGTDIVVPLLSGQAWVDANAEKLARIPDFPPGNHPFSREIAQGLYAAYAVDPGPSWEIVDVESVERFGGADALHRVALANLRRRGDIRLEGDNGRYALTVPDNLDLTASILLDPARWRAAIPASGDLVVAAPTRLSVWVCSIDDRESVEKLASAAIHGFENGEGKPVSPDLFRLSDTSLSRFTVA